jgi:hypothetical protein
MIFEKFSHKNLAEKMALLTREQKVIFLNKFICQLVKDTNRNGFTYIKTCGTRVYK